MTLRSIEAQYEYADDLREDAEEQAHADMVADMMNRIEDVLEGHEYVDVFFVLSMLLVSSAKEERADPAYVYGAVNMHVSAAWAKLMKEYDSSIH